MDIPASNLANDALKKEVFNAGSQEAKLNKDAYQKSLRSLSEHKLFTRVFRIYHICQEEKAELKKNPVVNAFKSFNINKLFRELYMPEKKKEGDD